MSFLNLKTAFDLPSMKPQHIDLRRSLPTLRSSLTPPSPVTAEQEEALPAPSRSFLPILLAIVLFWGAVAGICIYLNR
jgi:hypothetical protein